MTNLEALSEVDISLVHGSRSWRLLCVLSRYWNVRPQRQFRIAQLTNVEQCISCDSPPSGKVVQVRLEELVGSSTIKALWLSVPLLRVPYFSCFNCL